MCMKDSVSEISSILTTRSPKFSKAIEGHQTVEMDDQRALGLNQSAGPGEEVDDAVGAEVELGIVPWGCRRATAWNPVVVDAVEAEFAIGLLDVVLAAVEPAGEWAHLGAELALAFEVVMNGGQRAESSGPFGFMLLVSLGGGVELVDGEIGHHFDSEICDRWRSRGAFRPCPGRQYGGQAPSCQKFSSGA